MTAFLQVSLLAHVAIADERSGNLGELSVEANAIAIQRIENGHLHFTDIRTGRAESKKLIELNRAELARAMEATGWGRVWTSTDGKRAIADFVEISGANLVVETLAGTRAKVPLDKLSQADRKYAIERHTTKLAEAPGAKLGGRVVSVVDGDTIHLLVNNEEFKIRLEGIDAPEKSQSFGNASKKYLSTKAFGKDATVETRGLDKYGRILGVLSVGEECVNQSLVAAGLAWHYKKYSSDPGLAAAEQRAKDAGVGLWSEPNPIPPWDYRRWGNGVPLINVEDGSAPHLSEQDKSNSPEDASTAHWLNTSSNVRHNRSCRWYERTARGRHCTANEGKPCGMCGG